MVRMLDALIGISIGLIVLVAVFSIAPLIGDKIDSATDVEANTSWDSANMTAAGADAVSIWTDNASLIGLAVLVMILGIVIAAIMVFGGRGE